MKAIVDVKIEESDRPFVDVTSMKIPDMPGPLDANYMATSGYKHERVYGRYYANGVCLFDDSPAVAALKIVPADFEVVTIRRDPQKAATYIDWKFLLGMSSEVGDALGIQVSEFDRLEGANLELMGERKELRGKLKSLKESSLVERFKWLFTGVPINEDLYI